MIDDKIVTLAKVIKESHKIVLFTGAGISVPSNIPDFRSSNGIYNEKFKTILNPEQIISHSFFEMYPDIFYDFYFSKMVFKDAKPNLAHKYFAELEKENKMLAVVTQNIDGLHEMAGSKKVYNLHGTIHENYCLKCHAFYNLEETMKRRNSKGIPVCRCGAIIKPNVVLYEESLDGNCIEGALNAIMNADTLIVVGTSLIVEPAASFIRYYKGHNLILINKSETRYDNYADLCIHDDIINVINGLEKEEIK